MPPHSHLPLPKEDIVKWFWLAYSALLKSATARFVTADLAYIPRARAYQPCRDSSAFQALRVPVALFVLPKDDRGAD